MLRPVYRFVRASILHSLIRESDVAPFANGKNGIEVVGLFRNATGIGESARLCARQLQDEGFKVRTTDAAKFLFKKDEVDWQFKDTASADEIGLRIIHLNPPMIPPYAFGIGAKTFGSAFNVGYWAWELENLPPEWIKSLSYINAVMAPSEFICRTIRRYTDKPVIKAPHAVKIDTVTTDMRQKLGMPDTDFVIASVFSVQSSIQRKNPQALIKAFLKSLGDKPNAHLIFKINPLERDIAPLRAATQNHPRIRFIEDLWPRADVLGLIQAANVYASLHRSEGFGLGMAEAMMLGTPVVATGWSGNMDFCNEDNCFPVQYSMISVQSRRTEFAKAGMSVWAEPDTDHAAQILSSIYDDPTTAQQKAAHCLQTTNQYFSQKFYTASFQQLKINH